MSPETSQSILAQAAACGDALVYLMGTSFVLGSLVTILILLVLDFIRRRSDSDAS